MVFAKEILSMLEGKVQSLTAKYDKLPLECDGLTRVLDYILTQNKVKHKVYSGSVEYRDTHIPLHFWIELSDGKVVDYRLRMWMKPMGVPHGVFKLKDHPDLKYMKGATVNFKMTPTMFQILTTV